MLASLILLCLAYLNCENVNRRLKKDVLSQLPPLRRTLVRVEPDRCELKAVLHERATEGIARYAESEEHRELAGELSKAQEEGLLKAPAAVEWVRYTPYHKH